MGPARRPLRSFWCAMLVTRLGGGSGDKERDLDVLERELIGAADGMDMEVGEREESRITIRFLARVTG